MSEDRMPHEAPIKDKNKNNSDQNKLYIIIASVVILIAVIAFFFLSGSKDKTGNTTANSNAANGATQAQLKIIKEEGNFEETIDAKLDPVRKINFGTSLKKIQAFEKKRSDTSKGDYQPAQDNSGYGYLTYSFNASSKEIPSFFGANINTSDPAANLVYVLKNKKLIEVRVTYGASTADTYDSMVATNTKKYGNPNLTRSYSNGTKITYWRTKDVMLQLYSQIDNNGVYSIFAYLSKIN